MKTIFKSAILLATVLMLSLSSCLSEDTLRQDVPRIDPDTERTVLLRIVQPAATRGVSRPVQDNEPLALRTGDLYLVHQTGIISHHFQIVETDVGVTSLTEANLEARIIHRNLLDAGVSLPGVPGTVTDVVVVGNYQGANALPTEGGAASAIGARVIDIISQHDAQGNTVGVNLFGEDDLEPLLDGSDQPVLSQDGNPIFIASVLLRPTVARFEIADITAAGNITAFTVDGIFLDGFYRTMTIDGTLATNATQFLAGDTPSSFTNLTYNFDTQFAVHDWRESVGGRSWTGTAGTSLTVQAGGTGSWNNAVTGSHTDVPNVWGYQVFAQSHEHARKVAPPSIVLRLSGITSACGSTFPDPQFVTVGGLVRTVEGVRVPLTEILASRVYRIPSGGLVFDENDLSPHPNDLEIEAQIEILLDTWNPEEVLPDAPLRQPNPPGMLQIGYDNGGVLTLGAAYPFVGVTYQWQMSTDDGATWEDIPGATAQNHTIAGAALDTPALFRRMAMAGGNVIATTPVRVDMEPALETTHPQAVSICHGGVHVFDLEAATGGWGAITYQWQASANGTAWTDMNGATDPTLTVAALTTNTHFRRVATAADFGTTVVSNGALVTVHPLLTTQHPMATTIYTGTTHTFNVGVATGGSGTIAYQWQSSTNGTTWTTISGATGQHYTTAALTANTHFRRQATNTCGTVHSNSVLVTVAALPTSGALIGGVRWATRNVNTPNTLAANPHSAGRIYQWGTLNGATHHWPATGDVTGWNNSGDRVAWTAANQPCPAGWRLPTQSELEALGQGTWHTNWNGTGVNGRVYPAGATAAQVMAASPTAIFLPTLGWRESDTGLLAGGFGAGRIWSNERANASSAWRMRYDSSVTAVINNLVSSGYSIRCVQ